MSIKSTPVEGPLALRLCLLASVLFVAFTTAAAIPSFTISASPSSLTIAPGNQNNSTITTTVLGGFYNQISLSASGVPSGTTVSFSLDPIPAPGSGNSTMTIRVGNNTPAGTYPITVTGTGEKLHRTTIVTLTVPASGGNFTIWVNPVVLREYQGGQGNFSVGTTVNGGFNNSITLSVSGLPSGTTASFNPNPIPAPGGGHSTMAVTIGNNTPAGTYPLTVTGNGGGIKHTAMCTLVVAAKSSFTISASPSSLSIAQGNQGISTITTAISGGFNSSITLSVSGTPSGTTVGFNPNPIPAPGSGSSTMTITVGGSTPTGTYPLTVTGNGGGIQQHTTVTLTVTAQGQPNFTISASPSSLSVAQGNQGTSTITTVISGGFNSSIALSASGMPSGTTVGFNPNPIPAPGSGNSTMTITVGGSTPTGTYPITVTGNGGGIQQHTTVTLTVTAQGQPNFTISASPASLSIVEGNEGASIVTTAISGGFNSSINLSAAGAPTGTTVSFNPPTIPAPGAGNSTMTITVGSSTPVGTYPIIVTGNGGGIQQNTTVTLTVIAASCHITSRRPFNPWQVKSSYLYPLFATQCSGSVTWSIVGTQPPGLGTVTSPKNALAGTPTTLGSYTFTLKVTDSASNTDSQSVTVQVVSSVSEPVPAPPNVYIDTTYSLPVGGNTWTEGTNCSGFQACINSASPGDVIVLQSGKTYTGNYIIPALPNPSNKWIYVQPSAYNSLPAPETRIDPSDVANMATIVSPNLQPVIQLSDGANYWRFIGLEVTSSSTTNDNPPCPSRGSDLRYYNCVTNVLIDSPQVGPPILTNNITIDRCYLHGSPTQDVLRGVDLEVISGAVIDSYISDIHKSIQESQAILAYFTPGPLKIVDNYLSSAGENLFFGGAGVPYNTYVPSDIEIRRNHFINPLSWFSCGDGGTVQPCESLADGTVCQGTNPYTLQVCGNPDAPINQWDIKNNLEFKNAQRVIVTGNVMENSWVSGQTGSSVLFTIRTGQSGDQAVVDDITIQSNILKNVDNGFNSLYADDGCDDNCTNNGESRRVWIDNNLVLLANAQDGSEHWIMTFSPYLTDYVFQHNTVLMIDGSNCGQNQPYFVVDQLWGAPPFAWSVTDNMWVLDNALCNRVSGDNGLLGTTALDNGTGGYMREATPLTSRFFGNVMFVPSGSPATWPANNDATTTPFTYVDPGSGDYQLLIPDWTDTTDGKISGIDWNEIQQAMNNP